MTQPRKIVRIEDLSRSQRSALRSYLDPRMHITLPIISTAFAIFLFVNAVMAVFGVAPPLDRWFVAWLLGYVAFDWVRDLIKTIRAERDRVAKLKREL